MSSCFSRNLSDRHLKWIVVIFNFLGRSQRAVIEEVSKDAAMF